MVSQENTTRYCTVVHEVKNIIDSVKWGLMCWIQLVATYQSIYLFFYDQNLAATINAHTLLVFNLSTLYISVFMQWHQTLFTDSTLKKRTGLFMPLSHKIEYMHVQNALCHYRTKSSTRAERTLYAGITQNKSTRTECSMPLSHKIEYTYRTLYAAITQNRVHVQNALCRYHTK